MAELTNISFTFFKSSRIQFICSIEMHIEMQPFFFFFFGKVFSMEGIDQGPLHHRFLLGCVTRTLKLHHPLQAQELVFAFYWLITAFRNDIGSSGCYISIQIAANLSFPLLFNLL